MQVDDKKSLFREIIKNNQIDSNNDLLKSFYEGIINSLENKGITLLDLIKKIERDPYRKDQLLRDLNQYKLQLPDSEFLNQLIKFITELDMNNEDDKAKLLGFYKSVTGISSYQKIKIEVSNIEGPSMRTCFNTIKIPRVYNLGYDKEIIGNNFLVQ